MPIAANESTSRSDKWVFTLLGLGCLPPLITISRQNNNSRIAQHMQHKPIVCYRYVISYYTVLLLLVSFNKDLDEKASYNM